MTLLNVPHEYKTYESDERISYDFNLTICKKEGKLRFIVGDVGTSWMSPDDDFIDRINFDKLNPCFRERHIAKEIGIKNTLDMGIGFLENEKYSKAIECLDEVLYYDLKSSALPYSKS